MAANFIRQQGLDKSYDLFGPSSGRLQSLSESTAHIEFNSLFLAAVFLVMYVLWYLIHFIIVPLVSKSKTRFLPYFIPFLGNAVAFYQDPIELINQAINVIFQSRDAFAIYILGQTWYIVTAIQDISLVYNDGNSFEFDVFLNQTLVAFGVDKRSLELAWHKPVLGDECHTDSNIVNPKQKPFIDWIKETYRKALLPGEHMDAILSTYDGYVISQMESLDLKIGVRDISLKELTRTMMGKAITGSLFGEAIFEIEPNLIKHSNGLSDEAWKLLFALPSWATKQVTSDRERIRSAMERFRCLPKAERIAKGSSWPIETLLTELKMLGMSLPSNNTFLLLINWAANFNTLWICFWLLSHLLWRPELMNEIKTETQKAINQRNLNSNILMEQCPLLQSFRGVAESKMLSGKLIHKGNRILVPHFALHYDEHIWGQDSHSFVADRFIQDKSIHKHTAYRPFGGGTTYCPGRVIARAQISIFVATFLDQFDATLVPGQRFPSIDNTKPSIGTPGPLPGMDLRVMLSRPQKSRLGRL